MNNNKKPVILHCIDSLGVGGAETLLKNTLPLLTEYENIVCYLHPPDTLLKDLSGYTVYCLHHNSKLSFFQTIKRIREIIKKHNVSIIHSHLFYITLFARIASSSKTKFIFTVHNLLSKDAFQVNSLSLIAERITYKRDQIIVAVSNQVLEDYNKWVKIKGKSFILYNYIGDNYFNLSGNHILNKETGLKLVAIGNLRRQKNYPALLNAFIRLKSLPISLDIYGSGEMKNTLDDIIKREKINVRLMDRNDDISKVLPLYNAYIMPSSFEGCPMALMEAMAAGMPLILSNIPVFRELAEDSPIYFDPQNPDSIAGAVKYTYDHWQEIALSDRKEKKYISQKASKDMYITKLLEIYKN